MVQSEIKRCTRVTMVFTWFYGHSRKTYSGIMLKNQNVGREATKKKKERKIKGKVKIITSVRKE